ncbi:hypothetical protein A5886_000970 [Enterococcus sp. 8G7_MSG3316]|uniref:Mga helix-turn-helix domain-containing protein n=1 Tax=Candidatus Enterococcus testudinis TaxID=1834191 RepID=A0A242A4E5_9ENTE|nr:helix-turn-helix domain-containing protein [Enterococcus sp. 8G7_MSG3316]OTN75894.1 hypothetical protein A5886_000970 [Enterococcus sp. 8G7_MSG3316]
MKNFQLNFVSDKVKLRLIQILNELEYHPLCSTQRLTTVTKNTARTIITDINYLRDYLDKSAHITSSKQGYTLNIHNSEEYIDKKSSILEDEPLFIILERIFFNELLSIYEWADYFHVSESTMIKYLKSITNEVKAFNITLDLYPVNLIGSEADIRYFYFAFYYESDITPHTVFPSIAAQEAVLQISDQLAATEETASSFGYFSYLLYLSIERILCGLEVTINPELKALVLSDPEYVTILPAVKTIEETFQLRVPEDEIVFMYVSILCRRTVDFPQQEEYFCLRYNKWGEIKTLAHAFRESLTDHSLNKQQDLVLLESFFTSIKLRCLLSENSNKNIQDTNDYAKAIFPHAYQKNRAFLHTNQQFGDLFHDTLLEDICARLTLYSETIKEQYWHTSLNIAFAIEGNEYINQYITSWVKKYLGKFQTIHFLGPSDLCESFINDNQIDLLVTNYHEYLSLPFLDLEYFLIKTVPDSTDWARLLQRINPNILHSFTRIDTSSLIS